MVCAYFIHAFLAYSSNYTAMLRTQCAFDIVFDASSLQTAAVAAAAICTKIQSGVQREWKV
jgi:hypothetical protein